MWSLLLLASGGARATTEASGLTLDLARTGAQITQTEAPVVTLTASNRGTATANGVLVTGSFRAYALNVPPGVVITLESGCNGASVTELASAAGIYESVEWPIGTLAAGESTVCGLRLRALPTAPRGGASFVASIGSAYPEQRSGFVFALSPTTYVRDLELTIRSPAELLPAGSSTHVDVVLTNHGPMDVPERSGEYVLSEGFPLDVGDDSRGVRFVIVNDGDPDCAAGLADEVDGVGLFDYQLAIVFKPVLAGTSRTCTLLVTARAGAFGEETLRFATHSNYAGEIDPNPRNDSAILTLQHTPEPTAVPVLSLRSLIALVAIVWWLGSPTRSSLIRSHPARSQCESTIPGCS